MGKPGRPRKGFEQPKPAPADAIEVGYYAHGREWLNHLASVFGQPLQVMGEHSVPPSVNEGAVFYIYRQGRKSKDIFSDSDVVYLNIRRKIRESQSFRVEIRVEEHGLMYQWVSDTILYFRIDPARKTVSFFDSLEEHGFPVITVASDGLTQPSIQSLNGQSSVR